MILTTVGFPLLRSCPTSWKMLLQLMDLSKEPRFTMTATASRICSRTYFCRLGRKNTGGKKINARKRVRHNMSFSFLLEEREQRSRAVRKKTRWNVSVVSEGVIAAAGCFPWLLLHGRGRFIAFVCVCVFCSHCNQTEVNTNPSSSNVECWFLLLAERKKDHT